MLNSIFLSYLCWKFIEINSSYILIFLRWALSSNPECSTESLTYHDTQVFFSKPLFSLFSDSLRQGSIHFSPIIYLKSLSFSTLCIHPVSVHSTTCLPFFRVWCPILKPSIFIRSASNVITAPLCYLEGESVLSLTLFSDMYVYT